jgi:hypothetical protein
VVLVCTSDHQIGGSDHQIGGSDHQIGGSDHQIGGSDHQIGGSDHQIGRDQARPTGNGVATGGTDGRRHTARQVPPLQMYCRD